MENASKALIIAGAILLSILIIALGVFVFNQAKSAMSNTGLEDQKASSFNEKFTAYEGKSVSGSQVKSLIDIVRTNNNSVTEGDATVATVTIKTNGCDGFSNATWNSSGNLGTVKQGIKSGYNYTVKITEYYTSGVNKGYVKTIELSGGSN